LLDGLRDQKLKCRQAPHTTPTGCSESTALLGEGKLHDANYESSSIRQPIQVVFDLVPALDRIGRVMPWLSQEPTTVRLQRDNPMPGAAKLFVEL
jgi:hypothetical protein